MITYKEGFTFIELMIAILILSIVAVAIYSSFGSGINAWRKGEESGNLYQDARLTLNRIARDLRNTVKFSAIEFVGESQQLAFPAFINTAKVEESEKLEIGKVTYYLTDDKRVLLRSQATFAESLQEELVEPRELTSPVSDLNFSYCYYNKVEEKYEWKDLWNNSTAIPYGIKITLVLKDENSKEEVMFTKTVLISTGTMGVEVQ